MLVPNVECTEREEFNSSGAYRASTSMSRASFPVCWDTCSIREDPVVICCAMAARQGQANLSFIIHVYQSWLQAAELTLADSICSIQDVLAGIIL